MSKFNFFMNENPFKRVKNALNSLNQGNGVIILDDANRENEGDIIFVAETMTVEQMALTIRHGSGIVCLCITEPLRQKLDLPMMVEKNSSKFSTAFTVTIEASKGVTTGVSARDRLTTIQTAIDNNVNPTDLNRPGHVFPLIAREGGVLERQGHTEATIDLIALTNKFKLAGVLCELINDDGTMSRVPEILVFSKKYKIPIITIEDLVLVYQERKKKLSNFFKEF